MSIAIPIVDAFAFVAFAGALLAVVSVPTSPHGPVSGVAKTCMSLAMGAYTFVMFSNVLEHSNVTSALDVAEDYLEVLFPVLIVYALYAVFIRQRELELLASQRAALRSQEMVLGIMDAAPAGILVLDPSGRITFANEAAKTVLDLFESDSGVFSHPGWVVTVGSSTPAPDFSGLIRANGNHDAISVSVDWPTGWRVGLTVRAETLGDAAGRIGGLVATFLPPLGSRPHNGGS